MAGMGKVERVGNRYGEVEGRRYGTAGVGRGKEGRAEGVYVYNTRNGRHGRAGTRTPKVGRCVTTWAGGMCM